MYPVATATNFNAFSSIIHRPSCVQSQSSLLIFINAPNSLKGRWLQQCNWRFSFDVPQYSLPRKTKGKKYVELAIQHGITATGSTSIAIQYYIVHMLDLCSQYDHLTRVVCCRSTCDPELHYVLELATDSELYDLHNILFGSSYFSPLLKSLTGRAKMDRVMIGEDFEEREEFISMLESRFLYLAADARSTLRGWRPSYRSVLLNVRKKISIPCSAKLSTEDLEAEIFLHLIQKYSREVPGIIVDTNENMSASDGSINLENGLSRSKVHAASALMGGADGIQSVLLKGGGVLTLGKICELGGQIAAVNIESRMALLAAKQGVAGAATRYFGLRSMMTLLGPVLWGTLLADVVIQMLGTDYARVLRAIYAFAQIRIIRTYKSTHSA